MGAPYDFFHLIAHKESAEVRRFLNERQMASLVNFRNVAYETHASALQTLTSSQDVPVLAVSPEQLLKGAPAIIAFLQSL